ncbi:MAG: hypothetical protein Q4G28_10525 [Neisseria sp.]|nr:hypothetical protein [Neisseria sp.]
MIMIPAFSIFHYIGQDGRLSACSNLQTAIFMPCGLPGFRRGLKLPLTLSGDNGGKLSDGLKARYDDAVTT